MGFYEKAATFAGLPVAEYSKLVGIVLPTMPPRVFRLGDDEWTVALHGSDVIVNGLPMAAEYPELAQARYGGLLASVLRQDYVEQPAKGGTLREALLDALRADPDDGASRAALLDYLEEQGEKLPSAAYRVDGDEYGEEGHGTFRHLEEFLAEPGACLVQGLVVGSCWAMADSSEDSAEVVRALIAARERLPNLLALFLGDIIREESEVSWIKQCDLSPLLKAFPALEHFRARGGDGLVLHPFRHEKLISLTLEASNLSRQVVRAVGEAKLPNLEHLEIWLGTDSYGADTEPEDLAGVLEGKGLPALRTLALRNSGIIDDVIPHLAGAPVMERIRVLDLSLGELTDRGAEALLGIPGIARLEKLDIHHHYVSPGMVERLKGLGIDIDASDPQQGDDWGDGESHRYVAHSE